MSTVLPEGENLRNAVRWVSEARREFPERRLAGLIEDAGLRFDLSPRDVRVLEDFFLREG